MRRLFVSLLFVLFAVSILCSTGMAQGGFGGPWSGQGTLRYYVSPTGSNGNWGTVDSPWQTITHAVMMANYIVTGSNPVPVTINVLGGTYTSMYETFPIEIHAKGIALEALGSDTTTIQGDGINDVILFSEPYQPVSVTGYSLLPDSVFQGFAITGGCAAIRFDPSRGPNNPFSFPLQATVRYCEITGNEAGIIIYAPTGWLEAHVIDENHIHNNFWNNSAAPNNNCGIVVDAEGGVTSPLIRSNDIHDHEFNILVHGSTPLDCQPRIYSNFIYLGQFGIVARYCVPRIINNTIAFGKRYVNNPGNQPPSMDGVTYVGSPTAGGNLTLVNNIIWIPPDPNTGYPGRDLDLTALNGATVTILNNNFFQFFLPWIYPGNFALQPSFVLQNHPAYTFDLRLLPTSALVGLGNTSFIDGGGGTSTPININVGIPTSMTVRADLSCDIHKDARINDYSFGSPNNKTGTAQPEIGADEVVPANLNVVSGADAQGNMYFPATQSVPINLVLSVTGNPLTGGLQQGDAVLIYCWNNFATSPIYQNQLLQPYGNLMLDPLLYFLAASGTVGASGNFTVTFPMSYPNPADYEFEFYVQALRIIPVGQLPGDYTNVVRVEYNEIYP